MALRGNLKDFSLPDVFQLVAFSRKTGVLRISRQDGAVGTVWFREGDVFFASSNWHTRLLGERLVEAGRITPGALDTALEIREAEGFKGRRLGQILVDQGAITEKVLETFVSEQIQDTIFDLMRWSEGDFDFESMPEVADEDIGLSVSIENVIMEGARRLAEWNRIRKKIPSTDVVFIMSTAPGEGTFEISLKPSEWRLLLLIDGTRSVADLAVATSHTDFEVARTVYGLFSAGLLEFATDEQIEKNREERARREAAIARMESAGAVAEEEGKIETAPETEPAPVPESETVGEPAPEEVPEFLGAPSLESHVGSAAFEHFMGAVLQPGPVEPTVADAEAELEEPEASETAPESERGFARELLALGLGELPREITGTRATEPGPPRLVPPPPAPRSDGLIDIFEIATEIDIYEEMPALGVPVTDFTPDVLSVPQPAPEVPPAIFAAAVPETPAIVQVTEPAEVTEPEFGEPQIEMHGGFGVEAAPEVEELTYEATPEVEGDGGTSAASSEEASVGAEVDGEIARPEIEGILEDLEIVEDLEIIEYVEIISLEPELEEAGEPAQGIAAPDLDEMAALIADLSDEIEEPEVKLEAQPEVEFELQPEPEPEPEPAAEPEAVPTAFEAEFEPVAEPMSEVVDEAELAADIVMPGEAPDSSAALPASAGSGADLTALMAALDVDEELDSQPEIVVEPEPDVAPVPEIVVEPEPDVAPAPEQAPESLAIQEILEDEEAPSAGVISTDAYLEDITISDLGLATGLGDELSALTGAERRTTMRPQAVVNSVEPADAGMLHRDTRVDKATLLKIIDGLKDL